MEDRDATEPKAPLLLPGVLGERRHTTSSASDSSPSRDGARSQVRRATSDVTQTDQAVARARAVSSSDQSRLTRSSSSRHGLLTEDDQQIQQMVEELDRFMDRMREEPETLRKIVSRWPQAWDGDELQKLRRHRTNGLRAFEGPIGYKRPEQRKKAPSLKDTLFTPLGLAEVGGFGNFGNECDKMSPDSSPSRQARHLRDDFLLGKQVLTDFTLIHLTIYSHEALRHISTLLEANADVNTPATYQACFFEGTPSPASSSPKSPFDSEACVVNVTALHLAIYLSRVEVVRTLLSLKASPDSRATFDTIPDYTALHLAAAIAKVREEQALHQTAAPHFDKNRALHAAETREDAHQVIRLLLMANADVKAADLAGRSCLHMLWDLGQQNVRRWTQDMDSSESTRLNAALSAGTAHKFSEMELESSIFKGLIVRLPDAGQLTNDEIALLASESLQLQGPEAIHLSARDLGRLFRKDFRVVDLHRTESTLFVDCQLMRSTGCTSPTRPCLPDQTTFRFPRYITTSRRRLGEWLSTGSSRPSSPDSSVVRVHSDFSEPAARFGRRKAWRCLGVVAQGHEFFERMMDHLRYHINHTHKKAEVTPIRRFSTSPSLPNFGGVTESIPEEEEAEPDTGAKPPPRPSTTTGALTKSRTVMDFTHDNPFGLLEGSVHVDVVLDMPLPPGARYKKSWILRKGCLLHYAAQMAIKSEEEHVAEGGLKARQCALDDLQLVLDAKADVLARAYYRGRAGAFCTTTALHMVAAPGLCIAAAMLLKAKASIEVTSTMNGMAYYHPLHNAAYCGAARLCRLLLKERANPNTTNNEGRTGLHLAVKQNHIEIVKILVEFKANVVMRDRCWIGGARCKSAGLTPLDMCRRATRQYSESERAEIMALLAPSFNGVNSFFYDIWNMAMTSDSAIGGFLVDQALKLKTPEVIRAVSALKAHAVMGKVKGLEDCDMTPIDYMATIIEHAPRVGVRVLQCMLLDDPDMEDNVRGALPARANLKPRHQDSWFPWRRNGWFVSPFLCAYQQDANSDRHDQETVKSGRERWPCWLHSEDEPDPPWHRDLAPAPGNLGRRAGDADVQVKVLLLANAIDVRILRSFSRVTSPDIFAELIVQAIIGCTFDQVANAVTLLVAAEEAILFLMFMKWAKTDVQHWRWGTACWCMTTAIAMKETLIHTFCLVKHLRMGWPLQEFLLTNTWSHTFKLIRLICLLMLVLETRLTYLLDRTNHPTEEALLSEVVDERSPRKLLGTNIVIQGMQIVLLLRNASPEAEFGRHILSIIHSFGRLWAILVVMVCFYCSFSLAFFVMDEDLSWWELMEKVYRGLLLADGDGIDFMEGKYTGESSGEGHSKEGHKIEWLLSCLATFLFTICLLNISIAVFQTEYEKALKESYLHFWQHRAFLCMQTLLGPRWPWGLGELGPRATSAVFHAKALKNRAWRFCRKAHRRFRRGISEDESEPMVLSTPEDDEAVALIHWAGIACAFFFSLLALVLFYVPVHNICSALCLSMALCVLQALAVRTEAMNAARCDKKFFLWICHRADFSPNYFIAEDVEKEDINELRSIVEGGISELKRGIDKLNAMDLGRRMEKLETHMAELDRRFLASTSLGSASEAPSPVVVGAMADIDERVQEVRHEMEATLGDERNNPEQDSLESLEWAAEHHRR